MDEVMAQELEIKLTLNAGAMGMALAWLGTQPQARPGSNKLLVNTYFDTPGACLNQRKAALRVRQKGDVYIQTLKTQGQFVNGMHQREEWEWPLAKAALNSTLLTNALLDDGVDLTLLAPVFETNFERQVVMIDDGEAIIECALDSGLIIARERQRPLYEVEFELLSGNPQRLLIWANQLSYQCSVFVNLISKAEQGYYVSGLHSPLTAGGHPNVVTEFFRRLGVAWLTGATVDLCNLNLVELRAIAQRKSVADEFEKIIEQLHSGLAIDELMTTASLGQTQLALLR